MLFSDGPLLNGGFGGGKGAFLPSDAAEMNGEEVLRWIQALVASNSLQIPVHGDVDKLPYAGQLRWFALEADGALVWSALDVKGCFCIFALPRVWLKYFAINSSIVSCDTV